MGPENNKAALIDIEFGVDRSFMSKKDAYTQAGRTAVLQNIQGTLQFLQRSRRSTRWKTRTWRTWWNSASCVSMRPGDSIIKPADGPVEHFYIVKQGRVVASASTVTRPGTETTFEITTGECFPLAALLGERATRTEHLAAEDTFCLQLNKPAFIRCSPMSAVFRDFALRGVSSLLDQVNQQVPARGGNPRHPVFPEHPLGELAMRHPVTCSPTPLREAVTLMHEQQVGSIVVVDEHKAHPWASSPCATCARWWPTAGADLQPAHRAAHDPGAVLPQPRTTAPSTRPSP